MTSAPRTIRIRRPPTLHLVDHPFLPRGTRHVSLDEIDARWAALCKANPAYFDGPTYHVLGVHRNGAGGIAMHVVETSFRYHAVQQQCGIDLGVRGLGVRGMTVRGNRFLLGRRADNVAYYPGLWEFLPAGTLEPGVEPTDLLKRELAEECGLEPLDPPLPLAVLFDPDTAAWQLVYAVTVPTGVVAVKSVEHTAIRWCDVDALPADLSPIDRMKVPLLDEVVTRCHKR